MLEKDLELRCRSHFLRKFHNKVYLWENVSSGDGGLDSSRSFSENNLPRKSVVSPLLPISSGSSVERLADKLVSGDRTIWVDAFENIGTTRILGDTTQKVEWVRLTFCVHHARQFFPFLCFTSIKIKKNLQRSFSDVHQLPNW